MAPQRMECRHGCSIASNSLSVCLALFAVHVAPRAASAATPATNPRFERDRIIVRFDPDEIAFPGEAQSGELAECVIRRPAIRQALASVGARRVSRLLKWRRPHETTGFNRIGERIRLEDLSGLMVVELPPGADVEVAARRLALEGGVRYAHPNAIPEPQGVPNDSLFGLQWYLHSIGQSVCGYTVAPNADINAPEAWDVWTGRGIRCRWC